MLKEAGQANEGERKEGYANKCNEVTQAKWSITLAWTSCAE